MHQFRVLTVLLFSELTFNFSVHSQEVFASVFFAPESDDNIGQHGNKQVSVLRQLTPCRNWNKHKIQTVQSEKKHSVLLCCLSQLPFRRRSIVNVSRLMRSAALKQCWSHLREREGQAGVMTPSLCIHYKRHGTLPGTHCHIVTTTSSLSSF